MYKALYHPVPIYKPNIQSIQGLHCWGGISLLPSLGAITVIFSLIQQVGKTWEEEEDISESIPATLHMQTTS